MIPFIIFLTNLSISSQNSQSNCQGSNPNAVCLDDKYLFDIQGTYNSRPRSLELSNRIKGIADDETVDITQSNVEDRKKYTVIKIDTIEVVTIKESDTTAQGLDRNQLAEKYRIEIVDAIQEYREQKQNNLGDQLVKFFNSVDAIVFVFPAMAFLLSLTAKIAPKIVFSEKRFRIIMGIIFDKENAAFGLDVISGSVLALIAESAKLQEANTIFTLLFFALVFFLVFAVTQVLVGTFGYTRTETTITAGTTEDTTITKTITNIFGRKAENEIINATDEQTTIENTMNGIGIFIQDLIGSLVLFANYHLLHHFL